MYVFTFIHNIAFNYSFLGLFFVIEKNSFFFRYLDILKAKRAQKTEKLFFSVKIKKILPRNGGRALLTRNRHEFFLFLPKGAPSSHSE